MSNPYEPPRPSNPKASESSDRDARQSNQWRIAWSVLSFVALGCFVVLPAVGPGGLVGSLLSLGLFATSMTAAFFAIRSHVNHCDRFGA